MTEDLDKLYSVGQKIDFVSNEAEYLAEEISKQSIEDVACFPLVASKMQERNILKNELLSKKKPDLDDLENTRPIQVAHSRNRGNSWLNSHLLKRLGM